MSDELQAAMDCVKASTVRAIKAELQRLTREASKSPSDVLALLGERRADRDTLTSSDPQPPVGTLVRDDCGREWENSGVYPCAWEPAGGGDPESWVKVAGNYGPVTVIEWGEDGTVPAGTPTPDFMYPSEKCPHCEERPTVNRVDEHVATEHSDLPPCTAQYFDGGHALYLCAFRAGHADGQYGDWHASGSGTMGRFVWNDTHAGAQPHREEA